MQQAIQEEFILDVRYTTYELAYKLAHPQNDPDVDSKKARKQLAKWLRLHPHHISQKIEIIIEHFKQHIADLLNGQAKAMIVTSSRKEAVRYKLAFDQYIKRYANIQAMVAFSGKVYDPESLPGVIDHFTENNLNPNLKGRDMREAFNTNDYQIMIVANKFQTGFDQPKLCAMYVDKKLSGVDAVQTLSRLNRIFPDKNQTFILDFVNEPDDIRAAFEPYYREAQLSNVTDPNIIYEIQLELDKQGIYTQDEILRFAAVFFDPKGTQAAMIAIIKPPTDRYKQKYRESLLSSTKTDKETLDTFKKNLGRFYRFYDFLSQIVDYEDEDLEKMSVFARHLLPNLKTLSLDEPIDM